MWEPMAYMRYTFTVRWMLTKHLSLGKGCVHLPPHMRKSMTWEYLVGLRALMMGTRLNNPKAMFFPWSFQPRFDYGIAGWGTLAPQCFDGRCQFSRVYPNDTNKVGNYVADETSTEISKIARWCLWTDQSSISIFQVSYGPSKSTFCSHGGTK